MFGNVRIISWTNGFVSVVLQTFLFLNDDPVYSGEVCNVGHSIISPNPSSDENTATDFTYPVDLGGMNVGYTGGLGSVRKVRRKGA